jgi:hypothetical protein
MMNLRIKAIFTSVVIIATLLVLAKAPALAQDTTEPWTAVLRAIQERQARLIRPQPRRLTMRR